MLISLRGNKIKICGPLFCFYVTNSLTEDSVIALKKKTAITISITIHQLNVYFINITTDINQTDRNAFYYKRENMFCSIFMGTLFVTI